jgi:hypothetical protein
MLPPAEVDGLWAFPNIRRDGREWGTAVLTRVDGASGERRRVYTARYMLVLKGKERGQFEAEVDEVGCATLMSPSAAAKVVVASMNMMMFTTMSR